MIIFRKVKGSKHYYRTSCHKVLTSQHMYISRGGRTMPIYTWNTGIKYHFKTILFVNLKPSILACRPVKGIVIDIFHLHGNIKKTFRTTKAELQKAYFENEIIKGLASQTCESANRIFFYRIYIIYKQMKIQWDCQM